MGLTNIERAQVIADELEGTANVLADALLPGEDTDIALLDAIDELIFLCVVCNWWCEIGELDDDGAQCCRDCVNE